MKLAVFFLEGEAFQKTEGRFEYRGHVILCEYPQVVQDHTDHSHLIFEFE